MELVRDFLSESNHIEGVYDARSLQHAMDAWDFIISRSELTKEDILETHKLLMRSHLTTGNNLGVYRKVGVMIGGRLGLSSNLIPEAMKQWITNANDLVMNTVAEDSETLLRNIVKKHHVAFEKIHPFIDGNGRMGRILMNWELQKVRLPVMVIKEAERQRYYEWFK